MIIGSPPCTAYSIQQNLRRYKPGGEEGLHKLRKDAERHLQFCCDLYAHQLRQCLYFVHEHPESAESWKAPCVARLLRSPGVMVSVIDQCRYGLQARDEQGLGPARKPTRIVTNSVGVNREMQLRCGGCKRHVQLRRGRAKGAALYPRGLCLAIARGIKNLMVMDQEDLMLIDVEGELSESEQVEIDALRTRESADQLGYVG